MNESENEEMVPSNIVFFDLWRSKREARDYSSSIYEFQRDLEKGLTQEEGARLGVELGEARALLDIADEGEAEDSIVDYIKNLPGKIAHLVLIDFARNFEGSRNPTATPEQLEERAEMRLSKVENKAAQILNPPPDR